MAKEPRLAVIDVPSKAEDKALSVRIILDSWLHEVKSYLKWQPKLDAEKKMSAADELDLLFSASQEMHAQQLGFILSKAPDGKADEVLERHITNLRNLSKWYSAAIIEEKGKQNVKTDGA